MFVYDLATLHFLAVNEAAVHAYGYSREEFGDMTIMGIRPTEQIPPVMEQVERSRKSGGLVFFGRWKHLTKDGRAIDVDVSSHSIQFNGRNARVVMAADVTEQLVAETALRDSEERFRSLSAAAPVGILQMDVKAKTIYSNEQWRATTGLSSYATNSFGWLAAIHPDDRVEVGDAWRRAYRHAGGKLAAECRVLTTDA